MRVPALKMLLDQAPRNINNAVDRADDLRIWRKRFLIGGTHSAMTLSVKTEYIYASILGAL